MQISETLIAALFTVSAGAVGFLLFLIFRYAGVTKIDSGATAIGVDVNRYRPMLRLLSEEDFQYLAESGCSRDVIRSAKARRRTVFRRYLRCLVKDYSNLLQGLRTAMVMSAVDRPDLVRMLDRNRVYFYRALVRIELSLLLHTLGVGKVDVSGLVDALEGLTTATGSFEPIAA